MKKTIIASLAVLASAAVLTTFALAGAGKFGGVQVNADPVGYSFTFSESNTTAEAVGDNYAIYGTTPRGAKVGVVGYNNDEHDDGTTSFTFNGASFWHLCLFDNDGALGKVGAYQFSTITGFTISFSGGSVLFDGGDTRIDSVVSKQEYKGLSITPRNYPEFITTDSITVSSLTIWYSC